MSSLWSETDLNHRQVVALAYDHLPLQNLNVSSRILNALLIRNHKLTIGDVIRNQTNLGAIGGLGAAGIKELDTKMSLSSTLCTRFFNQRGNRSANSIAKQLRAGFQLWIGMVHFLAMF